MACTCRTTYRNASDAFLGELGRILSRGASATPRDEQTKELLAEAFSIAYPRERFVVVPLRHNDPFAAIAETVWVLAGRDDMAFLEGYLPRARDFSDDGLTWRGGYGPRLRNWQGVDQVQEVLRLLTENPSSRRAAMAIFDPRRDFVASKDIPCNNWLHWMIRDGALDLSIAVRSSDVMWGFSGINTFEWSVLQECMAHWLGVNVGQQHWFVSSMHLYARHWDRGHRILAESAGRANVYVTPMRLLGFSTSFEHLDTALGTWFELESSIRTCPERAGDSLLSESTDPLFRAFLVMIRAYWLEKAGKPRDQVVGSLAELIGSDLHVAALQWLSWQPDTEEQSGVLPATGHPPQASTPSQSSALNAHISALHAEKTGSYGDSWKKRGEQVGILANIARKVDRLANVLGGAPEGDEAVFDTAMDAFVYSLKYCTYLLDLDPEMKRRVLGNAWQGVTASDGVVAFDHLLAGFCLEDDESVLPVELARELGLALSAAEALAVAGADLEDRLAAAQRLSHLSYALTVLVAPPGLLGR